jgi:hypothetical protein
VCQFKSYFVNSENESLLVKPGISVMRSRETLDQRACVKDFISFDGEIRHPFQTRALARESKQSFS